ncbi:hypothetical protein TH61_00520 [Rufibacter sp. DG15C]|uniref:DNA-methyltransferase n=1 Tax=Rufibacter sp. DG15C TaxID=1379909 RepID=UPI00078D4A75|nr:site-specific DNA-methyltransferase [Rufibacter sp. DG15C]AMM49963.1 hypothetical protein TH61_00520 [Rufibacter sp. DG15C]
MTLNTVFIEDALVTMSRMKKEVDLVLTSPPYNSSRPSASDKHNRRYDVYKDSKSDTEYIKWTIKLFKAYHRILKANGVVLYNLSYSSDNPALIHLVVADIIRNTPFTVADTIVWKKPKAMPNNKSANRLTRITETVYVFCRKKELKTFKTNKKVVSLDKRTGQHNYENLFNFIEAPNNDYSNQLNKATFSSELAMKLLDIYAPGPFSVVFDSFMGMGTTAKAALRKNLHFIGSEISAQQVEQFEIYKEGLPNAEKRRYKIEKILNSLELDKVVQNKGATEKLTI